MPNESKILNAHRFITSSTVGIYNGQRFVQLSIDRVEKTISGISRILRETIKNQQSRASVQNFTDRFVNARGRLINSVSVNKNAELLTSIVSYWPCDETSGTRVDSVSTVGNLTDVNSNVGSDTGKISNGALLNSATDILRSAADLHGNNGGNFSVAFWYKHVTGNIKNARMVEYTNGNSEFRFELVDEIYSFTIYDSMGADNQMPISSSISNGSFHYVVFSWDATTETASLYMDNQLQTSFVMEDAFLQVSGGRFIVQHTANTGIVDEIGYWRKVLTQDDRYNLWNGGNGTTYPFGAGTELRTTRTQTGLSRVTGITNRTQSARARMQKASERYISCVSKISANSTSQNQSSISRITKITERYIGSNARVINNKDRTTSCISRLQTTNSPSIGSTARIQKFNDSNISSLSRIQNFTNRYTTGRGRILKVADAFIQCSSSVQNVTQKNQSARADIIKATDRFIAGASRMLRSVDKLIIGRANISNNFPNPYIYIDANGVTNPFNKVLVTTTEAGVSDINTRASISTIDLGSDTGAINTSTSVSLNVP